MYANRNASGHSLKAEQALGESDRGGAKLIDSEGTPGV